MKIRKEATNWNQAGDVCKLDKWDDGKVSGLVLLFKRQIPPFPSDLIQSFGESWVTFTFFQILCFVAWSESGYKKSGKDFLWATPISSARKANQWLYLITHSSSIGLLSMLSLYQMSCSALTVTGQVHTLPAFHTVRGRTPCVVSVLPERRNSS